MNRVVAIAACSLTILAPVAEAQEQFTGTWRVTSSETAPWASKSYRPYFNPRLMHARIVIAAAWFEVPENECQPPTYHIDFLPLNATFEGLLPQLPAKLEFWGRHFGFTNRPVPTLDAGCSDFLIHMVNENTILFAEDNVVYKASRLK
jgi:hypothetical protein